MGSALAIEVKRSTELKAAASGKRISYLLGPRILSRSAAT
jgi:hypothetical protein